MDHAKHFQLQIDAKQGYFKQEILPLESSWTNIKILLIDTCSKVMFVVKNHTYRIKTG